MTLRSNFGRRAGGPQVPAGRRHDPHLAPQPQSWLTPPRAMLGAEGGFEPLPHDAYALVPHPADGLSTQVPDPAPWNDPSLAPQGRRPMPEMPYESRIDTQASSPGVLIRTPRRPEAIAPEHGQAMPMPPQRATAPALSPEAVRFVRTPDSVLMERRQRALEAEREAQRQAEALAEAQAAALAAAEAARAAAEAEALRLEELAAEAALAAAQEATRETVPLWRQPFTPPPGVRYFRTPDRPRKIEPAAEPMEAELFVPEAAAFAEAEVQEFAHEVIAPAAAEPAPSLAADWSEVPDWSDLHDGFGFADSAAIDTWASLQMMPAVVQPEAVIAAAPAPQAPRISAMAARAAIRPVRRAVPVATSELAQVPVPAPLSVTAHLAPLAPGYLSPFVLSALSAVASPKVMQAEPAEAVVAQEAAIAVPSVATVVPTAIPPRPVLLRSPKTASNDEPMAEEAFDEAPAVEAEIVVEAVPEESAPAQTVQALPRAVLPERTALIPANRHIPMSFVGSEDYELPSLELLALPAPVDGEEVDADELEQNALNLQQTVQDFGVRGDILAVRPGPVVTLYELEPAPGTKSSRVIGLSDDIARSMSAVSARVAVVPGRNVIGIELPNPVRETVYLRELLSSVDFVETKHKLALCLGKNIGGEPIIADLARMPHLLVAGTTGSGKSVAINTMILSLLYRLKPEECRLIMVDPKMLELSVYDGIPHLLSPVVTDPKKAVIALKWAVREMEERYKKMAKISVRNIDGYNARMKEARANDEIITRTVQTGFDRNTGEAVFEEEEMDRSALPYIVIVVDEMADLMMVAGKDIEGAIQRLAQMARAAGIHLIMATQRPSVDVITGTIKANFPTRISFQVTSKIDSRTILGEMGAEQLLGQGDMLFMAGGGRTTRVHGPFCSDAEVESVVAHLKRQGRPAYLEAVTADDGSSEPETGKKGSRTSKADKEEAAEIEEADLPVFDASAFTAAAGADAELYEQAIAVVLRDKKASTSYIQRRLQIGYNRAASIMERMEIDGIVGPANHAGKREILVEGMAAPSSGYDDDE
ncbi:DNA translocase FtsK [Methylobacterium organophilum]|uniref:DNA translocase FtsK n=1 Tax=Methylobacterium organophilum TaxID=410 RepID=UPI001F138DD1|nr:DNA translocase FtsK [Methylobacterium organophilum]UMY20108.1 DNA translocase FtsK [Methylobacterium organophilum]